MILNTGFLILSGYCDIYFWVVFETTMRIHTNALIVLSPALTTLFVFFSFVFLQSEDKTVLFAVGSTLVNCTNSYDVEKPDPQMVELAKYAKQHVPEEHPKVPFTLFFTVELTSHNIPLILHSRSTAHPVS